MVSGLSSPVFWCSWLWSSMEPRLRRSGLKIIQLTKRFILITKTEKDKRWPVTKISYSLLSWRRRSDRWLWRHGSCPRPSPDELLQLLLPEKKWKTSQFCRELTSFRLCFSRFSALFNWRFHLVSFLEFASGCSFFLTKSSKTTVDSVSFSFFRDFTRGIDSFSFFSAFLGIWK